MTISSTNQIVVYWPDENIHVLFGMPPFPPELLDIIDLDKLGPVEINDVVLNFEGFQATEGAYVWRASHSFDYPEDSIQTFHLKYGNHHNPIFCKWTQHDGVITGMGCCVTVKFYVQN